MKVSSCVALLPYMPPSFVSMLGKVDIETTDQLRAAGVVQTYLSLKRKGATVSLPFLWALEAAAAGSEIADIPPARRGELFAAVANEQAEEQSRPVWRRSFIARKAHRDRDSLPGAFVADIEPGILRAVK